MLDHVTDIFDSNQNPDSNQNVMSKLLIILSDGRGVFYEGIDYVRNAIQKALQQKIFIVFIILDIVKPKKSSIFEIKMPIFTENNPVNLANLEIRLKIY